MNDEDVITRLQEFHDHIRAPATIPDADVARGRQMLRRRRTWTAGTAAAAAVVTVLGIVAATPAGHRADKDLDPAHGPEVPLLGPGSNGWLALQQDSGDIVLVSPDGARRPLEYHGADEGTEVCPAWAPDGSRLLFGRFGGTWESPSGNAELVIVPVGRSGAAGSPTIITIEGFSLPEDLDSGPCPIWAPDGRWVALAGAGMVWVVDTKTGTTRRLPALWPSDLAWRPGTDELAIAGDEGSDPEGRRLSTEITLYSVSSDQSRQLGTLQAAYISWSPDGSTLAYTGGEEDLEELWLVDADGTNERKLVDSIDYGTYNHGIGPEWSPTGDRIVWQRLWDGPEHHRAVLVNVADGTQSMIDPPTVDTPWKWYPYSVSWSPDGTTLLFAAWPRVNGVKSGTLLVPADTPEQAILLAEDLRTGSTDNSWKMNQLWGRNPDSGSALTPAP